MIDQVRSYSRSDGGCSKGCSEKWWELAILKVGLVMASGCEEREVRSVQWEAVLRCSCCFRRRGQLVELLYGEDRASGLAVSLWGCLPASRVGSSGPPSCAFGLRAVPRAGAVWGPLRIRSTVSGALERVLRQWWGQSLRDRCWGTCRGGRRRDARGLGREPRERDVPEGQGRPGWRKEVVRRVRWEHRLPQRRKSDRWLWQHRERSLVVTMEVLVKAWLALRECESTGHGDSRFGVCCKGIRAVAGGCSGLWDQGRVS